MQRQKKDLYHLIGSNIQVDFFRPELRSEGFFAKQVFLETLLNLLSPLANPDPKSSGGQEQLPPDLLVERFVAFWLLMGRAVSYLGGWSLTGNRSL